MCMCVYVPQHVWVLFSRCFVLFCFFFFSGWHFEVFLYPQIQIRKEISYAAKYVKTAKDLLLFLLRVVVVVWNQSVIITVLWSHCTTAQLTSVLYLKNIIILVLQLSRTDLHLQKALCLPGRPEGKQSASVVVLWVKKNWDPPKETFGREGVRQGQCEFEGGK